MDPKDLLIADMEHFGESMWRNEEVGEKRFNFFVTLVTAVAAGLVALYTSDKQPKISDKAFQSIVGVSCIGLFVVGLMSYLRMLHRNRVTDQYQGTLKLLRSRYFSLCPDFARYKVPVPLEHNATRFGKWRSSFAKWRNKWLKGGYAETVGVIEGMLLGGIIFVFGPNVSPGSSMNWLSLAFSIGFALAVVLWFIACRRDKGDFTSFPSRYFRAGVGAIIMSDQGHVLALERSAIPGAWQLPQGGMEAGERPIDAVLREIKEETELNRESLQLVDRYPEPLVYELPPENQSGKTGLGQVQYWFLFKLKEPVEGLRLPKEGEFRAWAWLPFEKLVNEAVSFRKPVYKRLLDYLGKHQ